MFFSWDFLFQFLSKGFLFQAVAQSTGRTLAQLKADVGLLGDIGIVAEQSRSNQRIMFKPQSLTVRFVFDKLKEIAQMTGQAVSIFKFFLYGIFFLIYLEKIKLTIYDNPRTVELSNTAIWITQPPWSVRKIPMLYSHTERHIFWLVLSAPLILPSPPCYWIPHSKSHSHSSTPSLQLLVCFNLFSLRLLP